MSGQSENRRTSHILLLMVSLLVACVIGEVVLRLFYAKQLFIHKEERALLYHYDERLGWFPNSNSTQTFIGSHPIQVAHNSRGFRDITHTKSPKPGIMFVGDSFVWGYDVEAEDRFTDKLRSAIKDWDVFNLGVSGYATDQELLLLMDQFDYYKPRLVFLVFCTYNDDVDNGANNINNGAYFKPYFQSDANNQLQLKGVPVPKSLSYFGYQHPQLSKSYIIRLVVKSLSPKKYKKEYPPTPQMILKINDFVTSKGARLVIGLTQPHYSLENLCKDNNISYVNLHGETFNTNGFHWTPAGHATVFNTIYNHLKKDNLLDAGRVSHLN